jgi:hypothetical protein
VGFIKMQLKPSHANGMALLHGNCALRWNRKGVNGERKSVKCFPKWSFKLETSIYTSEEILQEILKPIVFSSISSRKVTTRENNMNL